MWPSFLWLTVFQLLACVQLMVEEGDGLHLKAHAAAEPQDGGVEPHHRRQPQKGQGNSRQHAALCRNEEGEWTLYDLDSKGGVLLNGEKVEGSRRSRRRGMPPGVRVRS